MISGRLRRWSPPKGDGANSVETASKKRKLDVASTGEKKKHKVDADSTGGQQKKTEDEVPQAHSAPVENKKAEMRGHDKPLPASLLPKVDTTPDISTITVHRTIVAATLPGATTIKLADSKSVFSEERFDSLKGLDPRLRNQLSHLKFDTMTTIQAESIPKHLQLGQDMLIKAPTGSGKTLAFLVPVINNILILNDKIRKAAEKEGKTCTAQQATGRDGGALAILLSPTKELATQTCAVAEKLCRMLPWLVPASLTGGENPKSEKARIRRGMHMVFATPGRLNYHLEKTESWKVAEHFQNFVLDEADRLLDMGFEKQVKMIFDRVVKQVRAKQEAKGLVNRLKSFQTMLVSATLTPGLQKLADFCLDKANRVFVGFGGDDTHKDATDAENCSWTLPSNLKQFSIITPTKYRMTSLVSVLLEQCSKGKGGKAIVFFSSCASVDFHHDLFRQMRWPKLASGSNAEGEDESSGPRIFKGVGLYKLHGNLTADERNAFLKDFALKDKAVLVASDLIGRGIDLPTIHWIIQYDPPSHLEEYLHRIGRTARCGNAGNSLLFLQPNEEPYLMMLKRKMEEAIPESNLRSTLSPNPAIVKDMKLEKVHQNLSLHLCSLGPKHEELSQMREFPEFFLSQLRKYVAEDVVLRHLARKAFLSWCKSYSTFPKEMKSIFSFKALHPGDVASSFCLNEAPREVAHQYRIDDEKIEAARNMQKSARKKGSKSKKSGNLKKRSLPDRLAATKRGQSMHTGGDVASTRRIHSDQMSSEKNERFGDEFRRQKADKLKKRRTVAASKQALDEFAA